MRPDNPARPRSAAPSLPGTLASLAVAFALTRVTHRPDRHQPDPDRARPRSGLAASSEPDPQDASRQPGRGRGATSPTEIPARGWWDILRRTFDEMNDDRILAVAAGLTFYSLLALFPAVGAFVSLYGLFADPAKISGMLAGLGSFLPGGAVDIIGDQVHRITSKGSTALGFAFFSGIAVSLWSANAGMKALFDALNIAYEEKEKRNFILLNLWSLGFTLGAILFLLAAIGTVVVIPIVLNFLGLGFATETLISLARWPVLLVVMLLALGVLFRYGPSRTAAKWRWITPGALLAAIGWILFSMVFSYYVAHFGSYNETYGSLGAVIGFMTWMWLSATIVLVSAELNAELEHQTARDSTAEPDKPLGARGARMADTVGRRMS